MIIVIINCDWISFHLPLGLPYQKNLYSNINTYISWLLIFLAALVYSFPQYTFFGPMLNRFQDRDSYAIDVRNLPYKKGGTYTAQALYAVGQHIQSYGRSGVPKIVVTLTDGISASESQTISMVSSVNIHNPSNMLHARVDFRRTDWYANTFKFRWTVTDFRGEPTPSDGGAWIFRTYREIFPQIRLCLLNIYHQSMSPYFFSSEVVLASGVWWARQPWALGAAAVSTCDRILLHIFITLINNKQHIN